jgi:IS30 family transposase
MKDAAEKGRLAKKLTEDEVEMIKNLSSEGYSQRFLAKSFDVSQPTIQRILSGKIWKDGS